MNEIAAQLPADTAAAPGRSYALPIGAWLKPYRVEVALIGVAALASAALMLWLAHSALLAAAFCGGALILGALVILIHRLYPPRAGNAVIQDWGMLREAAAQKDSAIAITDRSGRLVCANDTYATWFEAYVAPAKLGLDSTTTEAFNQAGRAAWRDGNGNADVRDAAGRHLSIETLRVGRNEDHLLWRFTRQDGSDVAQDVALLLTSKAGVLAGMAGIMLVLVDADGRIKACNPAFAQRATGELNAALGGSEFVAALASDTSGMIRFKREAAGLALRLVQVSLSTEGEDGGDSLILLLDQDGGGMPLAGAGGNLQNLLEKLPLGLALTDRDCRFIFLNSAFRRAAGVPKGTTPIYPGDLVIREDKAAVADTVRRFANGTGQSGDLAVRLNTRPEEPVALSLAGAKGLGEAAVLLSLKDNSEEARLKREIAQATKMQAVGQLAGGVAHDFNNVLTAIIGTCDLMLLRHTPGDSDYGDIHQIKLNS
ncbi:MAG: PAS domain-containing protein, partial [Alphaproteobacteria bacterium]|nr:PAS domain-containing protein [Alphaproteobacteria bacterium]